MKSNYFDIQFEFIGCAIYQMFTVAAEDDKVEIVHAVRHYVLH